MQLLGCRRQTLVPLKNIPLYRGDNLQRTGFWAMLSVADLRGQLPLHKHFFARVRAMRPGQPAAFFAHHRMHYALGNFKTARRIFFVRIRQHIVQNRRRAGNAGHLLHRRRVKIARPHSHRQTRGITDSEIILIILAGARFRRSGKSKVQRRV